MRINRKEVAISGLEVQSLFELLRANGLFGARFGSEDGQTGADAVLVDGKLKNSSLLLVGQLAGSSVETVEGLAPKVGELHPIQEAFIEIGAIQSGYSTPAMILAAKALLDEKDSPTEEEVRDALSGILDRETGYIRPVNAIMRAAARMRGEDVGPVTGPRIVPTGYPIDGGSLFGGGEVPQDGLDGTELAVEIAVETEMPVKPNEVVGKMLPKVDSIKLAKGKAAFVDDIEMRGMLYAALLTSPHAHARIVSIDDTAARELPGVHAVIHHENIERVKYASGGQSYPNPLPYDQVSFDIKVRHVGDRVAAVAAESAEIAHAAVRLITVEYEVLPAVFDEMDAIAEGAPVIHDEADTNGIHDAERNIVHKIEAELGDVEQGFAESHHVFEHEYYVHQVQQAPIEPHIAISWWDSDERMVIRTSTQVPFHVRRMVAPLIDLPVSKIRVIKPRIGGGFGVKQEMLIEDIVAHLTIATGRPVRFELTRSEEFRSSRTRHPASIRFKSGVSDDGILKSMEMTVIGNTGAYGTHGLTVLTVTGLRGLSSYNCENRKFDCTVAYTNLPVPGAYRGYGGPQALFALEIHIGEIADALGIDRIDFRKKNWVQAGDLLAISPFLSEGEKDNVQVIPIIQSCGLAECFVQGMEAIGWDSRYENKWHEVPGKPYLRRGLGEAMCMHGTAIPGLDMGGASVKINDDGSFNVLVGATDLGTGSDTVLAQIAAEVLGCSLDKVIVYSSDTDMTPFDTGAYASSTTYISGTAVKRASEDMADQIRERAVLMAGDGSSFRDVRLANGMAVLESGNSYSLQEIALHSLHIDQQRQLMATASFVAMDSPPPFAGQFAEVEVDSETGVVLVKKLVMAVDAGVVINPLTAAGQVEGGMIQALGYGLCEEMAYDEDGRLINDEFGPYHIFRADEIPELETILVETHEPTGPFGAKAIAEIPKDGVAPALSNAIADATGVQIREIPLTPERVYRKLSGA